MQKAMKKVTYERSEREREIQRETERDTERDREREGFVCLFVWFLNVLHNN